MNRVSIDGPSASGKTTLGHWLSTAHGLPFLDTGLTFRTVGLAVMRTGKRPHGDAAGPILSRITHRPYDGVSRTEEVVTLDGIDVTHLIWSETVNGVLPWVAEDVGFREAIREFHLAMTTNVPMVVAGRDVALSILTDADLHIYLTATFDVRRERRRQQIQEGGWGTPVVGASSKRDLDVGAALSKMANALCLDTSDLSIIDVREAVTKELGR